uniref:Uncharacterized protein n=1 Tax=Setaria digitata TaxID=48799 RepID=A0A915PRF1_9BILA
MIRVAWRLRELATFVAEGKGSVPNQICCLNCYCPRRTAATQGGIPGPIYIILPRYAFDGFSGLGGLGALGGFGGLGSSYGPAVNGLCPIGVNIGGQCYAMGLTG